MKTKKQISSIIALLIVIVGVVSFTTIKGLHEQNNKSQNQPALSSGESNELEEQSEDPIVYDGMTMNELAEKLNRSLNSTVAGKGYLFASYSLELGVDPYLAVAIMLHETGCRWECSYLARECNNVGGQKGSPSCNGGSYMRYDTLDEGIKGFIYNIYRGYTSKGLLTPEQMGPKYAASETWASKVNWYIDYVKAN